MLVEHTLRISALCPADRSRDSYRCVIRTNSVVKVEDILAIAAEFAGQEIFQEDLTSEFSRRLGCEVETVGRHSNVRTRVVAGGAP